MKSLTIAGAAGLVIALVSACGMDQSVNSGAPPVLAAASWSFVSNSLLAPADRQTLAGRDFLPYGLSIPRDAQISLPPEPYDPSKHGQLTKTPAAPPSKKPKSPHAKRGRAPFGKPTVDSPPGDADVGYQFAGQGVYAGDDVQDNVTLPPGFIAYAPTHKASGGACYESTQKHYGVQGYSETFHAHSWYNFCSSPNQFEYEEFTDENDWKGKYSRYFDGELVYFSETYRWGSYSYGILYNFNTGTWDLKVGPTSGTPSDSRGWSAWESWYFTSCPTIPRIRAGGVRILQSSGQWDLITPSNTTPYGPFGICFGSGYYSLHINAANYNWEGYTP